MSKASKNPPPIKWRNNPADYGFPRSSKEAFGFEIKDGELEFKEEVKRGAWVWVVGLVLVLVLIL